MAVTLMATFVYLVRHGETVWNAEGRLCGSSDIPLSPIGQQQAQRLAQRLRSVPLAAIYSSPLRRTRQTAETIAALHNLPVHPVPELSEIDYGDWEGMAVDELARRFPEAERCRTDDPCCFVLLFCSFSHNSFYFNKQCYQEFLSLFPLPLYLLPLLSSSSILFFIWVVE